jgi:hypothetical protein
MLCRFLRILKESGFEGFHRDLILEYSGTAIPPKSTVEACFNVVHRLKSPGESSLTDEQPYKVVITGVRPIFYMARDSHIYEGRLKPKFCIMRSDYATSYNRANRLHIVRTKDPQILDTDYCDVDRTKPIVPDLGKMNIDFYLVNLNANLEIGESKSLRRSDLEDDETVLTMTYGNARYEGSLWDIAESLMGGGLPYYSIDSMMPKSDFVWDSLIPLNEAFTDKVGLDMHDRGILPESPIPMDLPTVKAAQIEVDSDEAEEEYMLHYNKFVKEMEERTGVESENGDMYEKDKDIAEREMNKEDA